MPTITPRDTTTTIATLTTPQVETPKTDTAPKPKTDAARLHSAFQDALSSGKTGKELDRALAQVLSGHDLKTGDTSKIRNIMSQDWCENMLMGIDTTGSLDESGMNQLMKGREYMAVVHGTGDDAEIYIIRNDSPKLDDKGPYSISKNGEDFVELDMTSSAQTVFRGVEDKLVVSADDGVTHHQSNETKGKVDGPFYHEKQKDGQCGIHAMNAMLGHRGVIASELTSFNDAEMVEQGVLTADQLYDEDVSISDAASGNDPQMCAKYLRHLADEGKIDAGFKNAKCDSCKVSDEFLDKLDGFEGDRLMLGKSNPAHFVAFRRDTNNEWHLVDSESDTQEKISPKDYIKREGLDFAHVIHNGDTLAPPPVVTPMVDPTILA